MPPRSIRVLVVDDSALMRELLSDVITAHDGLEVVGVARDGRQALELFDRLEVDVITLDVQMPDMDGLATLDAILAKKPIPVIMVSATTQRGADVTLDALDRGALDYVTKPANAAEAKTVLGPELARKIRAVAGANVRHVLDMRRRRRLKAEEPVKTTAAVTERPRDLGLELADKCVAIGISTGGPPALTSVFQSLAPPMPPIVVVQHMPANFTKAFAWRLNMVSQLEIKEAEHNEKLEPNHVLIAPGGKHMALRRQGSEVRVALRDSEPVSGHKPSVDVLMASVAELYGRKAIGLIMTGMGRDGADGCGAIRAAGGFVLGQDEATSDVYGMNKVALVEGHVDRQFALENAAAEISDAMRRRWSRKPALC